MWTIAKMITPELAETQPAQAVGTAPPSTCLDTLRHGALGYVSDVFSNFAEGAFIVDQHANVIWANEKYLKLLGVDKQECVLGKPITSLVRNSMMPVVVQTGKSIPFDIIEVGHRWVAVSRHPILDKTNKVLGGMCLILANDLDPLSAPIERIHAIQEGLKNSKAKFDRVRQSKYYFSQIIGNCQNIVEVKQQAMRVAASDSTVLLIGETGTGKELIAQAIHAASPRAAHNFVGVNVAAIPSDLIEAEFFGVAPGAYTGASPKGRAGKMALANGGTLFLDEVADMPLSMQVKLLRALQEREIEPVGSNTVTKLNIRLIVASSKDLFQLVKAGKFRADLYYRLNVIPIQIPPLRERLDDIPLLVEAMLEEICRAAGTPLKTLDHRVLDFLRSKFWSGNIRELRNVIERAFVLSSESVIGMKDFSIFTGQEYVSATSLEYTTTQSKLTNSISHVEREMIAKILGETQGNKMLAAKRLGISRSNLYKKIERYELMA
jgi:transcriptional regulator with PAS, ATPase and Fis domain